MLSSLPNHKYLFLQMLKRDIQQRYRGSQLGFLWAFFYPVLMLLVYTFVFSIVMRVRWGIPGQENLGFGLILFAGLLCHSLMAEIVISAVSSIRSNSQYVKKVVFPIEIISLVTIANAIFHMMLGIGILLIVFVITGNSLHWTLLLTPIVLLPFIVFLTGLSWFLAVLGVYVRDLGQIVGVLMTVLMFMCSILFPFDRLPLELQPYVLWLNPLTIIVEQLRAVMLFGQQPDWQLLGVYSIGALAMFFTGTWLFQRTRDGFADVI